MQVIYADVLVLTNLIINYILLLITAKICSAPALRLRMAAAALFGGLYGVAVLLPWGAFLAAPPVRVAVGALMVLASFGGQRRLLRVTLVFFAVSAAFGGVVMAASLLGSGPGGAVISPINLRILIPAFAVCYVVLSVVFRRTARHDRGDVVSLRLRHGPGEVCMRALRDTGNALTDPMTGRAVIVAGVAELGPLLPKSVFKTVAGLRDRDAVRIMEELADTPGGMRFQLVPYSAVGVAGGMLLAFKPDEIHVDGKNRTGMLLALSPNSVSDSGAYGALLGG